MEVSAIINGRPFSGTVPDHELLLDFLRGRGLTGVKRSCEVEGCGAGTVLVDEVPVSSCCYLACDLDGRRVETIEGLVGTEFHEVAVAAFLRHAAVQCGFCTAGMILTAKALLGTSPDEAGEALRGNLCRCTGYRPILDAVTEILTASAAPPLATTAPRRASPAPPAAPSAPAAPSPSRRGATQ